MRHGERRHYASLYTVVLDTIHESCGVDGGCHHTHGISVETGKAFLLTRGTAEDITTTNDNDDLDAKVMDSDNFFDDLVDSIMIDAATIAIFQCG